MTLFGRSEPLAVAESALEEAAGGRGGTLVVTGEAGIGKSALARALAIAAEARGARVGFGRAWEVGGAPAYWPWSQALGELGLDLDELLGSALGDMVGAQRLIAFDRVVRAVCGSNALPGPVLGLVVVILDDLHAADVASLELALAFARAATRRRVLLVVTTRESELLERREVGDLVGRLVREGRAVPLRRLDAAATASWLSSLRFDGDPSEVHRLSEGNPLFIEEAVRLGVDRFATAAAGGVPVILAEHLGRISPATRETLAAAAVLGREASHADVAALTGDGLDRVADAAREGVLAGVLAPERAGALAFSHVLLRDSVYEGLSPSRRAALHARAADALEARRAPLALVAQHLLDAGDAVAVERIVRTVSSAAEAAAARHAADSAIDLVTRARERLAARLDEATALTLDLAIADASMRTTPSDEARALCADCAVRAKRLGLAGEQTRAALAYGREILTGRVDATMTGLLEDALAVVPADQTSLRAQVLSRLGSALVPPTTEAGLVTALGHAHEALSLARAQRQDVPTLLHTLLWTARTYGYVIPLADRVEHMTELVSLAREHDAMLTLADVGGFYAVSLREIGRPVAAQREAEAYYRLVESLPLPALQWKAVTTRATMAAMDGRMDDARVHAEELRRLSGTSQHAAISWALYEVALAACTRDTDKLAAIESALTPILSRRAVFAPWMGCIHALAGRRAEALSFLNPVVEFPRGLPPILLSAHAAILLESEELAAVFYEPLAKEKVNGRFFWGPSGGFPFGPVSRILGELALLRGDHERARAHLDAAIAECREMDTPPFLALSEQARARVSSVSASATPPAAVAKPADVNVTLSREADVWLVTASTSAPFRVKHAKGLDYLHQLLRSPGREIYVLALAGAGEAAEDAGAILDEQAKGAYKRRVEDLEDQVAEAERLGDRGRALRAREELEAVAEHLAAAVGLGGRDRKAASNVERARVNVQRRIKDSIRRIADQDASLGRYLDATVHTGTYCMYKPM
jgi:hypothetical protein